MCDHAVVQDNLSDYPVLKNVLPEDYSYHVCSFESLGDSNNFRTNLKLRLTREDEVQKWQEDFQASSGLTWRKSKTYPETGDGSNKYRVDLRCHHHTRSSTAKTSKNTSCLAFMYLILKRQTYSKGRKSRSEDPHIKEGYYFHVVMKNSHNHLVSCAAALAKRDVSKETCEKLKKLFQSGHSPASALNAIKTELLEQEGSNYCFAVGDRSVCPDRDYCYRLYKKLFKGAKVNGAPEEMLSGLQKRLDNLNQGQGVCATMAGTDHAAQAMGRWLGSSHHGIPKGHQSQLMGSFQRLMYSDTPSSLEENYRLLTEEPVAKGHPQFIQHLAEVYGGREEWAVCLQSFPANELKVPLQPHGTAVLEEELDRVFKSLARKLREDPGFVAPLTSFIASYDQMTTDSALQSAFSTFGKSPMAKAPGYQRPKWYLQAPGPAQPTAVGRRTARLGSRRALGRKAPPYKRTGGEPVAPPSLAACGEAPVALGGTH